MSYRMIGAIIDIRFRAFRHSPIRIIYSPPPLRALYNLRDCSLNFWRNEILEHERPLEPFGIRDMPSGRHESIELCICDWHRRNIEPVDGHVADWSLSISGESAIIGTHPKLRTVEFNRLLLHRISGCNPVPKNSTLQNGRLAVRTSW